MAQGPLIVGNMHLQATSARWDVYQNSTAEPAPEDLLIGVVKQMTGASAEAE